MGKTYRNLEKKDKKKIISQSRKDRNAKEEIFTYKTKFGKQVSKSEFFKQSQNYSGVKAAIYFKY